MQAVTETVKNLIKTNKFGNVHSDEVDGVGKPLLFTDKE